MMQEVAKLREISFYYKFIQKYSCRYERTKVYYNVKFRVHNVGLLHDGRPEEKSNENEPIKHSIIRTGKEIRFRFWLSEDKAGKEAKRRPTGW